MAEKDPQKKSIDDMLQAEAIKKFGLGGVMEKIDKVMPLLEQVAAGAEVLKGQDGKTPKLGEDYLNENEQKAALDLVRPVKGRDYNDGEPGKDGYTPVRGLDYLTDEELTSIKDSITPRKGQDYFTQDEIAQIKVAVTPKKGVDYNDGANPTVDQFIEVVKGLKGQDMASFSQAVGSKIDISHVKNAGQFIFNGKKYDTSELMHGGGTGGGGGFPGGNIHDIQINDGSGGFTGSDNLLFNTYLQVNSNSDFGQILLTNTPATGEQGGLGINGANDQIIIGALKGELSIWNTQGINFSANAGSTKQISINTDGSFTIGEYTLPATDGSADQVLQTDGSGNVSWETVSGSGVTSVSGTANRITSTGGSTPVIDISASYVGQSSVTTLGTITTGVWHGTTIAVGNGGTGVTTIASKSIWVANALDTITSVTPGAGQSIRINAGNTAWEAYTPTAGTVTSVSGTAARITSTGGSTPVIDIDAAYVGQTSITTLGTIATGTWSATTIALNKGGTGQTTKAAAFDALSPMTTGGDIIYGGASGTGTRLANGSAGQVLTSSGTTVAPTWTTVTTAGLTVGTSTITSGTTTRILYDNAGVLGEYTITGTGTVVAMQTSPAFTTPSLGVATATSINGTVITASTAGVLTIASGKTLTVSNSITLAGTDATVMTFPTTTATIARTDAAQTFTGTQTVSLLNSTPQTLTVASNAATADVNHGIQNFTNSSAAGMTITLTTTSAVDGQFKEIRIYDFSAVAQSITWVNTENSLVTAPATSNGSTTLPLSVLFQFNGATSLWRCIAVA